MASSISRTRCSSASAAPEPGSPWTTTGVAPDLLVFAKGVNSGYVPLGGVLVGDAIYEAFTERPYPAGMTYSGHPLACAAAVGAIRAMQDEGTVVTAARLGAQVLGPGLTKLAEKHRSIGDVRGIGGSGPSSLSATG